MSWETRALAEVADFNLGKMLDQNKNRGELRPYLANVNVRWGEFQLDDLREMRFEEHELHKFGVRSGDILMCEGGEPGRCAIWNDQLPGMMFQKALHRIRPHECVDSRFLYYSFLRKGRIDGFGALFTGSTIKHLPKEKLAKVEIAFPSLPEQQRIAAILSAYDDLIEINRRRIGLLEDAARQLYKEWFVRFRFPGHEHVKIMDGVPEGWEEKTLREVATLNYGKALKDSTRIPGDVPVYGSSGIVGTHNKALVAGPGIILGRKGNVGSVRWSHSDFFPIDTVYFIASDESDFHLYLTLLHMQFMSTDVAVPGLNRDFAYSRVLLRPSAAIADRFEDEVTPIFFQMQKLTDWNSKLAKARDLLLPRLMNGTLSV